MELNLIEKLKYCPKGTKFWSAVYGEVEFSRIIDVVCSYPIKICHTNSKGDKFHCTYTSDGKEMECHNLATLFPSKDNHDWNSVDWSVPEVIIPEIGDFIMISDDRRKWDIAIYGGLSSDGIHKSGYLTTDGIKHDCWWRHIIPRDKFDINNLEESLKYDINNIESYE